MKTYVESKKKIEATRNRYGEFVFRGGISHLMDVGIRHLTKDNVEETCKQIMASDDTGCFMTNEFQCEIIKAAYDLAQVPHTDLLVYIQREVVYDIFDGAPSYEKAIKLLKNCIDWFVDDCCSNEEIIKRLEFLDIDDDDINSLGYGYLLNTFYDKEEK